MPITCPHCSLEFNKERIDPRHLAKCALPADPNIEPCLCGKGAATPKMMKLHRKNCEVWLARDKNAVMSARISKTSMKKYGTEHPRQAAEVKAKQAATNLERYGAENVFSKGSSSFEKVQNSLVGKRGVKGDANAFSRPEVQEKIRATNLERYGGTSPQHSAEVRDKVKRTSMERYGGQVMGSPVLREKIEKINMSRYGHLSPLSCPEVQAKVRATTLARFGVPYSCMDPEVRRKQLDAQHERYGSHFFASEEGKEKIRGVMQALYGVDHPGSIEGHWEKVVATFRERYGVDHPLQLAEFLDKRGDTNLARYGFRNALQNEDVKNEMVATKMERYGNPWGPNAAEGPNGLERALQELSPEASLLFTGDFTFWRYLPSLKHHKNPDFIVPGPDPLHPKKDVKKVVEAFGDYWHSRMFTGRAPFDHEQELISAYREVGIECLVLWESEVKKDPEGTRARLLGFLG